MDGERTGGAGVEAGRPLRRLQAAGQLVALKGVETRDEKVSHSKQPSHRLGPLHGTLSAHMARLSASPLQVWAQKSPLQKRLPVAPSPLSFLFFLFFSLALILN